MNSDLSFTFVCFTLLINGIVVDQKPSVNRLCRPLMKCTANKNCIRTRWLTRQFQNVTLSSHLYDHIDSAIDYVCIFTTGCAQSCSLCPLCSYSRGQIISILSNRKADECPILGKCAGTCVGKTMNLTKVDHCMRTRCAFHCFDGGCPKCKAFITRIFNQVCAIGKFRKLVRDFQGRCYQMFATIVDKKFESEFRHLERVKLEGQQ